uniref:Uncharacterized protein n=1 Tax=Rhizophora mucronata TaxID=61149 RepID=A0A2P2N860_RHIMU
MKKKARRASQHQLNSQISHTQ